MTFEELVDGFDYPMYVVTAAADGVRAGCLVGFATQCSIDPPRFAVAVSKSNHTHGVALRAGTLAVHALRRDQHDVAALFGSECGAEVDKLARVAWSPGPDGVPVLADCHGWFAGRVVARHDAGDHTLHLLHVDAAGGEAAGAVLTFAAVRDLTPGHPA